MSSRLTAQLDALKSLPAHKAAPATASLVQALHSAMERYPTETAQQGQGPGQGQTHLSLHSLYSGLLQQALGQLLDGAAGALAALPVLGHAEGRQEGRPLHERLLALLGQVSRATHTVMLPHEQQNITKGLPALLCILSLDDTMRP